MTKEEKEAILTLDTLALNGLSVTITEDIQKDIQIVLNLVQKLQEGNNNKDKIIDLIQKEISEHIGFENRLKRDNREPDMFNQGRFYVANNIRHILKQAKEV